jgi:transcriptional regulator with XRE-family HTH domain
MADTKCTHFQAALARETHLHTLRGLAELSGVQRATLGHYATGRSRPSIEALRALAKGLPKDEAAPLILAHLKDECPADVRPYLTLELSLTLDGPTPPAPAVDLDALFAGLRQLAETRKDIRDWLEQSYELIR